MASKSRRQDTPASSLCTAASAPLRSFWARCAEVSTKSNSVRLVRTASRRPGWAADLFDQLERLAGQPADDIQLGEPDAGEEILRGQCYDALKLRRRLAVEVVAHEHPAFDEAEIGFVERAVLPHDLVPSPILAEFIFDGFGNLDCGLAAGLQVLVALQVDLRDEIVGIQIQGALKMRRGVCQPPAFCASTPQ